ncbi:MAG: hypothetical protein K6357_03360 [Elusimicrobiota bacterium]
MIYKNVFFCCFFVFIFFCYGFSDVLPDNAFSSEARGTVVFPILKSPVSARFYSLGGVGSTLYSHDNVFYNPAAVFIDYNSKSVFFDFQTINSDAKRSDISYLKRVDYKTYGFYLSYIDYGDFTKIDESGVIKGSFSPYDYVMGFSYSSGKRDRFGFSVKYAYSNLIYETAHSIAADFGFILKGLKTYYSFFVRNLGIPAEINGKTYPLPFEVVGGVRYVYSSNLNGVFELKMPCDSDPYFAGGVEYKKNYADIAFYLRGGVNLMNKKYLGLGSIFSAGFGLEFSNFSFDYSFSPYSNVDITHKIAMKFGFGNLDFKKQDEKKEFKEFVAKQITMKKKLVVFDFYVKDEESEYGKIIANSIEERLLAKNHTMITRLDPEYIKYAILEYSNIDNVIKTAKKLEADFAIWGQILSKDEDKAEYQTFLINLSNNNVIEFSIISNVYDIRNISLKLSEEISKKISEL